MSRVAVAIFAFSLAIGTGAIAQTDSQKPATSPAGQNPDDILNAPMTPPRSDDKQAKPADPNLDPNLDFPEDKGGYSSSKDQPPLAPPGDDAKHPGSGEMEIVPADGVTEMKPWDPHEADKDVEVGLFYFKRLNYRAAEARYRDALKWQDNHAEARYRLAVVLDKEGKNAEAKQFYESYLKLLPKGEFELDSKKALERLSGTAEGQKKSDKKKATSPPS
jgi:tetratricopeptide (TPR) repeat protein